MNKMIANMVLLQCRLRAKLKLLSINEQLYMGEAELR